MSDLVAEAREFINARDRERYPHGFVSGGGDRPIKFSEMAAFAQHKLQAQSPAADIDHSSCHDVVCNADVRKHPRGAKGSGCSCFGRDKRQRNADIGEIVDAIQDVMGDWGGPERKVVDGMVIELLKRVEEMKEGK